MQEGGLDVEIFLLSGDKQQGGSGVDYYADRGHHDHHYAVNRFGIVEAANRLPGNATQRYHQQDGAEQRRKNSHPAKAVGTVRSGLLAGEINGAPGQ